MNWIGLIFVAGGIFSILGAVCDWEWFFNSRKARGMVTLIGRSGARLFYGVLGLALIVIGVLFTVGVIEMKNAS